MKKLVIVINGKGRSGKDTVCKILSKTYKVRNISSVDPIKQIAKCAGWNGEKDDKSRKMLADLKQLFIEYNDLPFNYALNIIKEFMLTDEQILFIHIRESEEIEKVVKNSPVQVKTLLVKRNDSSYSYRLFGNGADDLVENYDYDFVYSGNNETVEQLEKDFVSYFNDNIKCYLN